MPHYSLEELQDIVERQRKVYGDALDRITREIRKHGLGELAEYVQRIKALYGIGNFEIQTKERKEFIVRPIIDAEEGMQQVYNFLLTHKGHKFKGRDIRLNISGRFSEETWKRIRNELTYSGKMKASGTHGAQVYWIE